MFFKRLIIQDSIYISWLFIYVNLVSQIKYSSNYLDIFNLFSAFKNRTCTLPDFSKSQPDIKLLQIPKVQKN